MFCTTCGAPINNQQDFCTSCGSSQSKVPELSQGANRIEPPTSERPTVTVEAASTTNFATKKPLAKRALIIAAVALVGLILGTALTAAGLTEFAIGARYTQVELDSEKRDSEKQGDEAGYKRGYSTGRSDGYDTGYDSGQKAGYSAGLIRGCNNVFDEIGENLIAIRYPWYKINVYGYYWNRSSIC